MNNSNYISAELYMDNISNMEIFELILENKKSEVIECIVTEATERGYVVSEDSTNKFYNAQLPLVLAEVDKFDNEGPEID